MNEHEWTKYFKVDILDSEGPDDELEIPNANILKKTYVGKKMKNYDSCLVLSHFKGYVQGGNGGALKQLSIGIVSAGKVLQHTGGQSTYIQKILVVKVVELKNLKKQWLMLHLLLLNFLKEI